VSVTEMRHPRFNERPSLGNLTQLVYLTLDSNRLASLGAPEKHPKNYVLAEPDTVPSCCYLLISGRVITFEIDSKGVEHIYSYIEKGALLLEGNMLMQKPAQVYFKTLQASEFIRIQRDALLGAMSSDLLVTQDIIASLTSKFLCSMEQVRDISKHKAAWRLCNLLIIFAGLYGANYDGKVLIKEKISQQMISSLLSISRITVIRLVKQLRELNLIEQINGYFCIRDLEMLRRHMELLDEIGGSS
jgi:CRP/FNR family transcriptional regulator